MRGTKYGDLRRNTLPNSGQPETRRAPPMPPVALRMHTLITLLRTLAERGADFNRLEAAGLVLSYSLAVPVTIVRRPSELTCYVGERGGLRRSVRFQRIRASTSMRSRSTEVDYVMPAVRAGVFTGILATALAASLLEIPLAMVAMVALGCGHGWVRKRAGRVISERVLATSVSTFLSWLVHTSLTSTALASVVAGYILFCYAPTSNRAGARAADEQPQAWLIALFAATYAVTVVGVVPAHLDFFLLANVWRLAGMAVPISA